MHRVMVMVLAVFMPCCIVGMAKKACAAGDEPCCWRSRIGTGDVHMSLSWYVGVAKAVESRDVEVGLRLTLYRAPKGVRATPAAAMAAGSRDGLLSQMNTVAEALAAYGVLAPGDALGRFVRADGIDRAALPAIEVSLSRR